MINQEFIDDESVYRDPMEVLAELAAAASDRSAPKEGELPGRDADVDEGRLNEMYLRALRESRGIPESGSDRVAWSLYCRGILDGAVIWQYNKGYCAPFAWPDLGIALMLRTPLMQFGELSYEELLDLANFDETRDVAFERDGWLVVKVDPDSPALDDQLDHLAVLVAFSQESDS